MSRQGRAAAWIRRHRNGLSIALTVALIVALFGAWHAFTTPTFVDTAYGPMHDVVGRQFPDGYYTLRDYGFFPTYRYVRSDEPVDTILSVTPTGGPDSVTNPPVGVEPVKTDDWRASVTMEISQGPGPVADD